MTASAKPGHNDRRELFGARSIRLKLSTAKIAVVPPCMMAVPKPRTRNGFDDRNGALNRSNLVVSNYDTNGLPPRLGAEWTKDSECSSIS